MAVMALPELANQDPQRSAGRTAQGVQLAHKVVRFGMPPSGGPQRLFGNRDLSDNTRLQPSAIGRFDPQFERPRSRLFQLLRIEQIAQPKINLVLLACYVQPPEALNVETHRELSRAANASQPQRKSRGRPKVLS